MSQVLPILALTLGFGPSGWDGDPASYCQDPEWYASECAPDPTGAERPTKPQGSAAACVDPLGTGVPRWTWLEYQAQTGLERRWAVGWVNSCSYPVLVEVGWRRADGEEFWRSSSTAPGQARVMLSPAYAAVTATPAHGLDVRKAGTPQGGSPSLTARWGGSNRPSTPTPAAEKGPNDSLAALVTKAPAATEAGKAQYVLGGARAGDVLSLGADGLMGFGGTGLGLMGHVHLGLGGPPKGGRTRAALVAGVPLTWTQNDGALFVEPQLAVQLGSRSAAQLGAVVGYLSCRSLGERRLGLRGAAGADLVALAPGERGTPAVVASVGAGWCR